MAAVSEIGKVRSSFAADLEDLASTIEIIDVHNHVGPWRSSTGTQAGSVSGLEANEEARLREEAFDRFSTDATCLLPSPHQDGGARAVRIANDQVLEQLSLSPRVKVGLFTVPLTEPQQALDEMQRCVEAGLKALTLHHRFAGKAIDHPIMWPILEAARECDVPVFIHVLHESGLEALWRLEHLAQEFPEITFVGLNCLSYFTGGLQTLEVAKRCPNILFDTAVLCAVGSFIDAFCEQVGPERLLYGSDLYLDPTMYRFPYALYETLASEIGLEAKRAVLGGNFRRLFGLVGESGQAVAADATPVAPR